MSVYLINQTLEDAGITGLQILYDFSDFSGQYINSISGGDNQYSGHIKNFSSSFTGQSSGSGFFNGEYIEIENSDNISSENATIIFSARKTGINNSTIFSHLDQNGPSGWEVGVNEANKLYFKNFQDGTPNYYFFNGYLSDQNMCAVSVSEFGSVSLHRLNFANTPEEPFSRSFQNSENFTNEVSYYGVDSESWSVQDYSISNGSSWNIGSGEFLHEGYIDYFLYFSEELQANSIEQIFNAVYAEGEMIPAVSGQVSGDITGYLKTSSGVSGKIGQALSGTGFIDRSGFYVYDSGVAQTGCVGISGEVFIPYTGIEKITGTDQIGQDLYKKVTNLSYTFGLSGDPEIGVLTDYETSGYNWHFSGNSGTYKGDSAVGPANTIFGITGFEIVEVTGYIQGNSTELYQETDVSGTMYNEYSYEPQYAPPVYYLISGAYFSGNRDEPDAQYFPNSLTLIGDVDLEDFYEIIFDIEQDVKIEKKADIGVGITTDQFIGFMNDTLEEYEADIQLNGVSQFTGAITFSKNQYNKPYFEVVSGAYVDSNLVYTTDSLDQNDELRYDNPLSGEKRSLTINSLSDYSSSPFSFDVSNSDVFFNGVKIYSGIDYIYNGGFYPSGNVTGSTGFYFTRPFYSGAISTTGSGQDMIHVDHDEISPDKTLFYINGIRGKKSDFIEHARYSDLITGTRTFATKERIFFSQNGEDQRS
jgi:hypothetical protein